MISEADHEARQWFTEKRMPSQISFWRKLTYSIRAFFRRKKVGSELDSELLFHLEAQVETNVRAGMSREAARQSALRKFGGVELAKEECRDERGTQFLDQTWQDIRFGARMLRKNPGFTAVAVLTLALGIGANTAIFSVIRGVLLQALPFRDPSRIVLICGTVGRRPTGSVSYPDYLDARKLSHSFDDVAAYSSGEFIVNGTDRSERVLGEMVSDSYFPILGTTPLIGRTFLPEENQIPGAHPVAVIAYGLWQRMYGGDSGIIGKNIRLNSADYNIVGVMPPGFTGFSDSAEAWVPVIMYTPLRPQTAKFEALHGRDMRFLRMIGRLRADVSREQAQAEVDGISASLAAQYPKSNKDRGLLVRAARDVFVGSSQKPLLMLLGTVGFVLLIACANVVN